MENILITRLKEECLWTPENVLFLLGIRYKDLHPELEEYVKDLGNAEILSRKFLTFGDNGWEWNSSLLEVPSQEDYSIFIKTLNKHNVTSNGHLNRNVGFSIGRGSTDTKAEYFKLKKKVELIEPLDLNKLCLIISKYYVESEFPTKLARFLREEAYFSYFDE